LLKQADELVVGCASLSAGLHPNVLNEIKRITRLVNNYYSNLIESEGTHPVDIYRAMQQDFASQLDSNAKQHLALAYSEAQTIVFNETADYSDLQCLLKIHRTFYSSDYLLEQHKTIKDAQGQCHHIMPGQLRESDVIVGRHLAPPADQLAALFVAFHQHYHDDKNELLHKKLIKVFAAHHRFMYIHPFLDGNGRVGRLMTDGMLNQIFPETYGLWSLSRGLARQSDAYKNWLARADQIRQGAMDGRGQRTEQGLIEFIGFMLDTAKDQIDYTKSILNLTHLHQHLKHAIALSQDPSLFGYTVPKEMIKLIPILLVDGEIRKAELGDIMGCSERKARTLSKQLVKIGLLYDDSKFSPLKLRLPESMFPAIFPNIVPFFDSELTH
jgi:Fic family protein